MCGMAGIIKYSGREYDITAAVRRMADAQKHRGPDMEGFYNESSIALGHRRLSIIDLSKGASQPMLDATGRYVIVFNGEIYNYREIRAKIRNYPFRSNSDTEVILAAFHEWKADCLNVLKGQFAFSIWDTRDKHLFIARDRLGEKPFYYHSNSEYFLFSSEIRGLLASGLVPKKLSAAGVADYLINESVSSPNTIVEDVFQLPPAHYAWVSRNKFDIHRYWNIADLGSLHGGENYPAVCARIKTLMHNAIEGQMTSDVPLGAFLSGGIDSSIIVGLMAERATQKVSTLSITFDDERFDESRYSSLVARRFGTDHHEIRLKSDRCLEEMPQYFDSIDIPSGDGPNTYVVSKAAKEAGLTVALSGIGGDELFAGYKSFRWYHAFMRHGYLWRMPKLLRKAVAPAAAMLGNRVNSEKLSHLLMLAEGDTAAFYRLVRSSFPSDQAEGLLIRKVVPSPETGDNFNICDSGQFQSLPLLSQFSVMEFFNYTQNVLLKDADNMAMAHSLEIRVPFCDHELLEYVLSVPDAFKYPSRPKKLLIDAFSGLLPDEIIDRPKMGFSFPWGRWIKEELHVFCDRALNSLCEREAFNAGEIRALWARYLRQEGYGGWNRIWLLVTLSQWLEKTEVQ